jgi:hypothetical protein
MPVAGYQAGRSLADLAEAIGVHHRTVAAHLDQRGVQRRANLRKMSEVHRGSVGSRRREPSRFRLEIAWTMSAFRQRMEGAVAVAGVAAKLVGRHGGEVRVFLAGAGQEVNSTVFSIEYESPEAMRRAFDALADVAELQAFTTRLNGSASPTVITSQSMGMEMPIGRTPKPGTERILEAHTSRVSPGRMQEVHKARCAPA